MNSTLWIRKAFSACLAVAVIATYSMVTLAASEKVAGELTVSGRAVDGQNPSVKVNGEIAQTGRTIFSASTIATPENASAVVNVGKAGKIELAPNTVMSLSFDEKGISGDLSAGHITVLNAANAVSVKTVDGKTLNLNEGDSADAAADSAPAQTSSGGHGHGLLIFAIVLGGAAAGLLLAATTDNNRVSLGGGTTVVSTSR